jgi:long-chain acyl-CoA synthetase
LGRQVDATLAKIDLSTAQYRMLFQLADGAEASTNLARKLEVSAPSVTAVVEGLVQRKLVVRTHSELDRRRVSLALTDEGRRTLRNADDVVRERLELIASELEEDEGEALLQSLMAWASALDANRLRRLALREKAEVAHA